MIGQVTHFKLSVERHARALRHERAYARQLLAERRGASGASVADKLNERQRLLTSIKGEISTLEAQERGAPAAGAARGAGADRRRAGRPRRSRRRRRSSARPPPTPEGATVAPSSPYGGKVVSIAMSYLGVPYVWGGSSPGGFDCSGLVMYAFAQLGISLPHSSYAQFNYGTPVSYDDLQPGDLVFFDALGHVGIYIGGGEFVNAPLHGRRRARRQHDERLGGRELLGRAPDHVARARRSHPDGGRKMSGLEASRGVESVRKHRNRILIVLVGAGRALLRWPTPRCSRCA